MIIISGYLETPQTKANNPISYRFISLLSDINPFTLVLSHNYVDYYYYLKRLAMQGQEREIDTLSAQRPQPHTTNL